MTLRALREDALTSTPEGTEIRLSLPWIRSLPLSSVREARVRIDGDDRAVRLPPADADAWWNIQDRLVLACENEVTEGDHDVAVELRLAIPYLPMGDAPLVVRIAETARLAPGVELAHAGGDIR